MAEEDESAKDPDYEDDTDDDDDNNDDNDDNYDEQFYHSDNNNDIDNKDNKQEDTDGYTTHKRTSLKLHAEAYTNVGDDNNSDDDKDKVGKKKRIKHTTAEKNDL